MRNRDPFGAVLAELRRQIRNGTFSDGAPLPVADLALGLGVSQTPVREALAYLAGEGLIDGRQGHVRGYQVWRAEPGALADLLRLHQAVVTLALSEGRPSPAGPDQEGLGGADAVQLADFAEAVFGRWIALAGDEPLRRTFRLITDRLRPMRLREGIVLEDIAGELRGLAAGGVGAEVMAAVRAYHRRRLAVVARLAAAMR